MSKVKVSSNRSWIGLVVTVVAMLFLVTIMVASRESVPPTPAPIAQIEPSSTPTNEIQPPTPEPTPQLQTAALPNAYVLTKDHSAITIRDLETGEQHYTFGVGDEFEYQSGHVIIHRDRNARVIELTTGQIRWEGPLIEAFSILAGYVVFPEQNQFIVAEYINPINSQLQFKTYELDSNQLLAQATFDIETGLIFVPGISSNSEILMYSQTELIRYNLATKTQTKLILPALKDRSITAATKHPSQDTWYIIDDKLVLYQLTLTSDSDQPIVERLTEPSEEKLYELADIVATEKGIYFLAEIQIRNSVLFYYDNLKEQLIGGDIDRDFIDLVADPVEQGIWVNSYLDEHAYYWDGQHAINDKLPFESSKVISIEPVVPTNTLTNTALAPSSAPQPQIQPDSTPFVWIREGSLNIEPDTQYITSTIKTLAPDGTQTTMTTNAIAAFNRSNMAPLLLIEEQGYQLFDPAQQTYLPIEEPITSLIDRGYYTQQPYVPESLYLVNLDENAIAWIGTNNKGFEQLIVTNLTTGVQASYPFNLPGEFLRNEFVHLLGWHQSMIYFMHEENQIWQLNLDDGISRLLQKTANSFDEIVYIPQSQQIAFTTTDPAFQAYFNMYSIPQAQLEPIPGFKFIDYLSLEPATSLLSFIAHGDEDQATLMVQDSLDPLSFTPVYTFNPFDMITRYRANINVWIDEHTLQVYERSNHSVATIRQGWMTKITTIDIETDTLTQRFSTIELVHADQDAYLLKDLVYLDQGILRLNLVQVPQDSTQPDIVLSIEPTLGSSFIDVFYIPE